MRIRTGFWFSHVLRHPVIKHTFQTKVVTFSVLKSISVELRYIQEICQGGPHTSVMGLIKMGHDMKTQGPLINDRVLITATTYTD